MDGFSQMDNSRDQPKARGRKRQKAKQKVRGFVNGFKESLGGSSKKSFSALETGRNLNASAPQGPQSIQTPTTTSTAPETSRNPDFSVSQSTQNTTTLPIAPETDRKLNDSISQSTQNPTKTSTALESTRLGKDTPTELTTLLMRSIVFLERDSNDRDNGSAPGHHPPIAPAVKPLTASQSAQGPSVQPEPVHHPPTLPAANPSTANQSASSRPSTLEPRRWGTGPSSQSAPRRWGSDPSKRSSPHPSVQPADPYGSSWPARSPPTSPIPQDFVQQQLRKHRESQLELAKSLQAKRGYSGGIHQASQDSRVWVNQTRGAYAEANDLAGGIDDSDVRTLMLGSIRAGMVAGWVKANMVAEDTEKPEIKEEGSEKHDPKKTKGADEEYDTAY